MPNLPILSLAALTNGERENPEIRRLYDICYEHGFFYLRDHGVSSEAVQRTLEASLRFFNLPEATKLQYDHEHQVVYPRSARGYVPQYGEILHIQTGPDLKEIFDMGFERPLSDEPFIGPTVLPDDIVAPDFAAAHFQLQHEIMTKVVPPLLRAFSLALNLEAHWFDRFFTEPTLIQRVIYYPAHHSGAGKHTDNGIFTVLIQEQQETPPLRVYTRETWIDVPCLEDTFIINLGDMLQLWTNGLFVSTPHEVIHSRPVTRLSMPFFIYPNIDAIIEPFGSDEKIKSRDVMLKNFESIWVTQEGAGRSRELD